jgi:hypothetical protein
MAKDEHNKAAEHHENAAKSLPTPSSTPSPLPSTASRPTPRASSRSNHPSRWLCQRDLYRSPDVRILPAWSIACGHKSTDVVPWLRASSPPSGGWTEEARVAALPVSRMIASG